MVVITPDFQGKPADVKRPAEEKKPAEKKTKK